MSNNTGSSAGGAPDMAALSAEFDRRLAEVEEVSGAVVEGLRARLAQLGLQATSPVEPIPGQEGSGFWETTKTVVDYLIKFVSALTPVAVLVVGFYIVCRQRYPDSLRIRT